MWSNLTDPITNECKKYSISEQAAIGYVMIVVNVIASVAGTIGNFLVCIAVFTSSKMASSFHYFITSLAMADMLICGVDQPLLIALLYGRIHSECMKALFFAFRLIGNFACAISLLTLGLISVDRCLFVIRVCEYKNTMTMKKFVALVIVWTLSIVYSALRMTINKKITSYITVAGFGLGYITILLSYVVIFVQIRRHCRNQLLRDTESVEKNRNKVAIEQVEGRKERRFANTIILLLFVFSASWALLFYRRMTHPAEDYGIWYNIGRTVALSSSAFNPFLYCFMNSEYRKAFKRILLKVFTRVNKGYKKIS